jgi:hypothetical protein
MLEHGIAGQVNAVFIFKPDQIGNSLHKSTKTGLTAAQKILSLTDFCGGSSHLQFEEYDKDNPSGNENTQSEKKVYQPRGQNRNSADRTINPFLFCLAVRGNFLMLPFVKASVQKLAEITIFILKCRKKNIERVENNPGRAEIIISAFRCTERNIDNAGV